MSFWHDYAGEKGCKEFVPILSPSDSPQSQEGALVGTSPACLTELCLILEGLQGTGEGLKAMEIAWKDLVLLGNRINK